MSGHTPSYVIVPLAQSPSSPGFSVAISTDQSMTLLTYGQTGHALGSGVAKNSDKICFQRYPTNQKNSRSRHIDFEASEEVSF